MRRVITFVVRYIHKEEDNYIMKESVVGFNCIVK